jgi:hypothetical protein
MAALIKLESGRRFVVCWMLIGLLLSTSALEFLHHHDAASSTTPCQICHVVHAPVLPAVAVTQLPVPVVSCWTAVVEQPIQNIGLVSALASPRAPPAV